MRNQGSKGPSKGATAIEYAMLLAGMGMATLIGAASLGGGVNGAFTTADSRIKAGQETGSGGNAPQPTPPAQEPAPEEEAEASLGDPLVMTFAGTSARFVATLSSALITQDEDTGVWMAGGEPLVIDWGPGAQCEDAIAAYTATFTCTYDGSGPHTVRVPAVVQRLNGFDGSLVSVDDWGGSPLVSLQNAFTATPNLVALPGDLPPTVTSLSGTFLRAPSIPSDISTWNVAGVRIMDSTFEGTGAVVASGEPGYVAGVSGGVVPDITSWRPASVASFFYTFRNANFNQPIGDWTTGSALYMGSMFSGSSFDQDLSGWNVARVNRMDGMFQNTRFNHDIGGWDVGNVQYMGAMFGGNPVFNQDITGWDVSSMIQAANMFDGAAAFNQDIGRMWAPNRLERMSQFARGTTSLTSDFSSWRPVPSEAANIGRVFDGSAARGDLRCWDVEHIPAPGGGAFSRNAPGIIPPLWGEPPLEACALP